MSTEEITPFAQLALSAPVLKAIEAVGYETPSPIQAQSIPVLLQGRDLVGQAQTGTGKTAAFALPLLSKLDMSQSTPQALVLAPTRELAIQVAEAMQTYARGIPGFHVLPIYGGQSISIQLRQLKRNPHVIVGTPGRIIDHLKRKTLQLDQIKYLVLDEADEMLRMGFIDDVEEILSKTPKDKQTALFSATMPAPIRKIAARYLNDPQEISIKDKTATVAAIRQRYWLVKGVDKLAALTRILEVEDFDGVIVFVRTKTATVELAEKLAARGHASAALNGDMSQVTREQTVDRLKRGKLDILVATDVVARGLDVKRISHVINYDIPYDTEAYVHRIGRTGRAGNTGETILFVVPREQRMLRAIENANRQKIEPMTLPSREDIADHRSKRFKQKIAAALNKQDLSFFEQLVRDFQQEHSADVEKVAAALAYLAQRDRPLVPAEAAPGKPERSPKSVAKTSAGKKERTPKPRTNACPDQERTPKPRTDARSDQEQPAIKRTPRPRSEGDDVDWVTYRLEVGAIHNVTPKNIVGAIANEAGVDSQYIGGIDIQDKYSTVRLPEGMPKPIFKHLKKVWVCGQQLQISVAKPESAAAMHGPRPKPRKPAVSKDNNRVKRKPRV